MIITIYLSYFFVITSCQYISETAMKPDITFADNNDRFDVTSIIEDQNRFYGVGPQEYRRHSDQKAEELLADALTHTVKSMRRSDADFAYHDTMIDEGEGDVADFERNLENFKKQDEEYRKRLDNIIFGLHEGKDVGTRRRAVDAESEILLHYAVPVDMKVEGYLQVPLDE